VNRAQGGVSQKLAFSAVVIIAVGTVLPSLVAHAQDAPCCKAAEMTRQQRADVMQSAPTQVFHMKYLVNQAEMNELNAILRQDLDQTVKVFIMPAQNAIAIRGLPDDIAAATKLIDELDRPRASFRLTYTVSEFDGARKVSSEHYTMSVADGQSMTMKQGSRVPVSTGKYNVDSTVSETQMAYQEVGMAFDNTLSAVASGASLKFAVEQSSVANPVPAGQDPVIQQTELKGTTMLPLGKATPLGSLDIPNSTRRLEIEALLEKLP
jgi:type II secretory pathway component GspD/PulD (secretin)